MLNWLPSELSGTKGARMRNKPPDWDKMTQIDKIKRLVSESFDDGFAGIAYNYQPMKRTILSILDKKLTEKKFNELDPYPIRNQIISLIMTLQNFVDNVPQKPFTFKKHRSEDDSQN